MPIALQRVLRLPFPIVLAAGLLAGCGGGGSSAPKVEAPRGVFTSANDCAAAGKLTLDQCSEVIGAAINQHVAAAPTYASLKSCEKVEGPEKCERTDATSYRPQLVAYLVTMGSPPSATPLYPTIDGKAGFRTLSRAPLADDDDKLPFSKSAVAAYERHMGVGKAGGGGGGFGL